MDDTISRQAAIRWIKAECNPYGKPTLDYETSCRIMEHLDRMPSAEPEIIRCKDCKWFGEAGCAVMIVDDLDKPTEDDYCSFAERKEECTP